jgi:hypothetical protein
MFLHPSIHGEIARQLQQDVLARTEPQRIACVARVQEQLRTLAAQRQALRRHDANDDDLKSNRLTDRQLGHERREAA